MKFYSFFSHVNFHSDFSCCNGPSNLFSPNGTIRFRPIFTENLQNKIVYTADDQSKRTRTFLADSIMRFHSIQSFHSISCTREIHFFFTTMGCSYVKHLYQQFQSFCLTVTTIYRSANGRLHVCWVEHTESVPLLNYFTCRCSYLEYI